MEKHNIVIKFNKEVIRSRNNQVLILKSVATQDNFLTQFRFKSIVSDEMLVTQNQINTVNFENLVGICYVQDIDNIALEEKEHLAQKMNAYDFVEYAYVEKLVPMELPFNLQADNKEIFSNKTTNDTPSFIHLQNYKDPAGIYYSGIDMEYAWSLGITGKGIRIADIEYNFNYNHVNLKRDTFIELVSNNSKLNLDHGTAVAGVMYAKDVGFGVKGMVHGADAVYGISEIPGGRVGGIVKGLEVLRAGDVFIYEMQTGGVGDIPRNYVPSDFNHAVWDVTQEALKAGIIIMMAAGNGNVDLDLDIYSEYRNRIDNGVIRVGGGDRSCRHINISTYGSMIHVQGWVEFVTTTGYGDLYNGGTNNNYTKYFNGTSSATPIAASAAVAIQSWYKQQTGKVLTPHEMRALLIKTGTPQNNQWNSNHIGPLPNVRNAIKELQRRLQLPTDYPLWDATKLYIKGDKVSWKNKKWGAISNNRGWEPGDNSEFWREIQ